MTSAIIMAAGSGQRVGLGYNKLLYTLKDGSTILEHTISKFLFCDEIIVVVSENDKNEISKIISNKIKIVIGGDSRDESVFLGVSNANGDTIIIHDGARPFIKTNLIMDAIDKFEECDLLTFSEEMTDSIAKIGGNNIIQNCNRQEYIKIQTPQIFHKKKYLKIYDKKFKFTDESALFIKFGYKVKVFKNNEKNIKITYREDLNGL